MAPVRIAQYGTKHGHAGGKLLALRRNPDVEFVGIFEPDQERRLALAASGEEVFQGVRWFADEREFLTDPTIIAVASEGLNEESLAQTEAILRAGKHVWYDKPAGENWEQWRQVVNLAEQRQLILQMGYMFRYHTGFRQIAEWVNGGLLGKVYAVRAHMSTNISITARQVISHHTGGIFYDLAGHMLDQIVALLGRPTQVTAFLRNDSGMVPGFADNTLGVLSYPTAMAYVDIAAMETLPPARRFEVYGSRGSAIMEPFEPVHSLRLCLAEAHGGYQQGEQMIPIQDRTRQELYELELAAFVECIHQRRPPERTFQHDLVVQETLLRVTGIIPDDMHT